MGTATPRTEDLWSRRKTLDEICEVPEKIISVYSLEKHVWTDSNSEEARRKRQPELQTLREFQLDPVRPFLTDVLRNMAAPYKRERRDSPIGQGYWIQAEFGSGKSHLLCTLCAIALGSQDAWDIVQEKEKEAGRGKRESLYRFWEEGLAAKSKEGRGIFVIARTLVGSGGGPIGLGKKGERLTEYILDAAKEQLQLELGKNVSLYPVEVLADRFINTDLERYRADIKKFLRDPRYFDETEFTDVDEFIRVLQENRSPEYKRSCGNKLWRFYTEYLNVRPQIPAETEDIMRHLVETILAEGYVGVLLVLDEVSLFMKNRADEERTDDEQTLVVLSNRLAKVHNLPVWTICSAQQAIESKMGVKNIIADDRLKLVKLLEEEKDYYDIALSRVRKIKDPGAISNYYVHYKRGFTWPNAIGETEFARFFPFHKPAIEVVRAITYELTTARSAIAFMHQTLKHQVKNKGNELIRLWELFDEAVRYEEDPSGVHAGLVAIKTKRDTEYRAYEDCKRQIEGLTKGVLKVHHDKATKTVQTLFLYYLARTRQRGLTPEEIANSVLIERDAQATPEENIEHYETIAENLKTQLRQVVQSPDEGRVYRYRFEPAFQGIDPREEFTKARDQAEASKILQREAWEHLLGLSEWLVRTRQMTLDLSHGVKSIFRDIAPFQKPGTGNRGADQELPVNWQGRQIVGLVAMRDLAQASLGAQHMPPIASDETGRDFAVFVASSPLSQGAVSKLLSVHKDPRVIVWTPDSLTKEESGQLVDFAAYRKMVSDWQGKDSDDAHAVLNWVWNALQGSLGKIETIVNNSYARGQMDAMGHSQMQFQVVGELAAVLSPPVERVLGAVYESRLIKLPQQFPFRNEEAVKVINGIVKVGSIPKNAKPNQDISAVRNFGQGLMIMKKGSDNDLDISANPFVVDMWSFIDAKLTADGQTMKTETLYKNFMGLGTSKNYGLSRRLVQMYLLCLVHNGKVKVSLGPKSGQQYQAIDYSNIARIDFSARVLDAVSDVQKVVKPENWGVLRPYAEKLLGEVIIDTHDGAIISGFRDRLRGLFVREKEASARTDQRAARLFDSLKASNPYATELAQVARLFAIDFEQGDDVELLLHALKEVLGYQAFETRSSAQTEADDLANRLKNYRDMRQFLEFDLEILSAFLYCEVGLPDVPELRLSRKMQSGLKQKFGSLRTYIDSEVKLKTELLGKLPPEPGETDTRGTLIYEYTAAYSALHNAVVERGEKCREEIRALLSGKDMAALKILEGVSALKPAISGAVEKDLAGLSSRAFGCPMPSRASVEESLKNSPVHECDLTFDNAAQYNSQAGSLVEEASERFNGAFTAKLEVFMNASIRARLEQGKSEPVISGLLGCKDVMEVKAYLTDQCFKDTSVVDLLNRYLKRIVIIQVSIQEFKPTKNTVEAKDIPSVAKEFQKYLEQQIKLGATGGDDLPLLRLE